MTSDHDAGYSIPDASDPHYTEIGKVASAWALLEAGIDGVIANLANTDEQSMACVTAQLIGPARRMDALIALFKHRKGSDQLRKELKSFQGKIQQLGEDRNRVVHDAILKGKATGQIYKALVTAKGELKYGLFPVSIKDMETTGQRIRDAMDQFSNLKKRIDAEMNHILQEDLKRIGAIPHGQNPLDEIS